jgi:hypothetical protein
MERTNIRLVPMTMAFCRLSRLYARRLSGGYPPVIGHGAEDRSGTANP